MQFISVDGISVISQKIRIDAIYSFTADAEKIFGKNVLVYVE